MKWKMKKRTRIRPIKLKLKSNRLFTDFGGISYYKVLRFYRYLDYCESAITPTGSHWFSHEIVKIRTESGVVYKLPWIELGLRSVYADTGEMVLK